MKVRRDPSTKQYYRCLSCHRFRKECGGIPTRGMDLKEWCEYLRDVKETFHLTNASIAKEADVSLTTIERIMAIDTSKDIIRGTARRIETVVLGAVGQHICELDDSAESEKIRRLTAEVEFWREDSKRWREENDRKAKIIDKYLDA